MPSPACFLAHVAQFDTRIIDSSLHPPPYVLCGKFADMNFVCDASSVTSAPSWSLRHTFMCIETRDAARPQMVLECYSSDGAGFVGMCFVQMSHLQGALSSEGSVVVALQLRNGNVVGGEISFHAELEALHTINIHIPRMSTVPHAPSGTSVYVELFFSSFEGSDAAVCVMSEQVELGVGEWTTTTLPPLLQCKVAPAAMMRNGVIGRLFRDSGEQLGHFRITAPTSVVTALVRTSPEAFPLGKVVMEGQAFDFDVPVDSTLPGLVMRCVGTMRFSTADDDGGGAGRQVTSKSSATGPPEMERSTEPHANGHSNSAEDLRVLKEVLNQQQRMLGMVCGRLAWVRETKASVQQQLKTLHHCQQHLMVSNSRDADTRSHIESELQQCIMRWRQLQGELTSLQSCRAMPTEEEQRNGKEEGESAVVKMDSLREDAKRLRVEIQRRMGLEQQQEQERLRNSQEQQQLNKRDAETLMEVMSLLEGQRVNGFTPPL